MSSKILLRRGTAAQWTSANPTLGVGELGIETDTLKIKVGNGSSTWTQLTNYINVTPSGLSNSLGDYILLASQGNAGGPAELDSNGDLLIPENSAIFWNDPAYSYTTTLTTTQPTANRVITFPNATGTVALTSDITSAVTNLINAAPSALDTLNELAAAINNDSSFSTTVNNLLSGKVSKSGGDTITAATASTVGLIIRPATSQTANVLEVYKDNSTLALSVRNNLYSVFIDNLSVGSNVYSNYQIVGGAISGNIGNVLHQFNSWNAAWTTLGVRGYASQTANLQEWQNSSGTVLASIDASGQASFKSTTLTASSSGGSSLTLVAASGQTAPLLTTSGGAQITAGGNYFKAPGIEATYVMNVTSGNSTTIPFTVKGASSQTADLQRWVDSSGTILSKVDSNGQFYNYLTTNTPAFYFAQNSGSRYFTMGNGGLETNTVTTIGGQWTTTATLEVLSSFSSRVGLLVKGISTQTADLQQWKDSAGTTLASIDIYGNAGFGNTPASSSQGLTVRTGWNPAVKGIVVIGASSQTADLQQWQNSSGTVLAKVDANGFSNATGYRQIGGNSNAFGDSTISNVLTTFGSGGNASVTPIVVKGATSQAADLQQWQNSTGTVLAKVNSAGVIKAPVAFGDFWGPVWETMTPGGNDQGWKKLATISPANAYYSGLSFDIQIYDALTNFGSSAYPEISRYTIAAVRSGGVLDDAITMVVTGPEGNRFIRGMKINNGSYEIQFRQPADWRNVIVKIQAKSAQSYNTVYGSSYSYYSLENPTTASTGGTIYEPIQGGTHKFSYLQAYSIAKFGGTSSQFLKADGSTDSSSYFNLANSYVAGHHPEGRMLASAALQNDLANARLRGSTFTFTNISPSNSDIDRMFDGTANFFMLSPTSSVTFPIVIEFTLPRTLSWGTTVGIGFGNSAWRANSVKIEAFSEGAWVTCIDTTTNTSEDVLVGVPNNLGTGTTKLRYTLANPNSSQLRICHLWAYNYNSDMWTQLQMPRSGGTMYGSLTTQGSNTVLGSSNTVQSLVRGTASQTSNLQEWQNSSGVVLGSIASDGTTTLGYQYSTNGTHKIYGVTQILNNSSGTSSFSVLNPTWAGNSSFTIGTTSTDNANNRNWQFVAGGGGYAGQSGNYIGEGGLILFENNPNDSSVTFRAGFRRGGQFALNSVGETYSANLSIKPISTSTAGIVIRANSSQIANLQEWQNSAGTILASVDSYGNMVSQALSTGITRVSFAGLYGASLNVIPYGTAQQGIIVRAVASQTADLQQWQDSSGTVISKISKDGQFYGYGSQYGGSQYGSIGALGLAVGGQSGETSIHYAGGSLTVRSSTTGESSSGSAWTNNTSALIGTGYAGGIGLIIKSVASQTADLQQWQNSAGTVLSYVRNDGLIYSPYLQGNRIFAYAINSDWANYSMTSTASSATSVPLGIRGAASQTANLQEWQNSAGTVLSNINSSGLNEWRDSSGNYRFGLKYSADRNIIDINSTNSGLVFGWSPNYIGGYGTDAGAGNTWWFSPFTGTRVGVIIIGKDPQTADLQQWQNNSGTVLSKVDASGNIFVGTNKVLTKEDEKNIYITDSGTARTLGSSDAYKILEFTSSSLITVTIPNDASDTTFPIGSYVEVRQMGGGQITVSATSPATLVATDNQYKTRVQYSAIVLEKRASNAWYLAGDTTA